MVENQTMKNVLLDLCVIFRSKSRVLLVCRFRINDILPIFVECDILCMKKSRILIVSLLVFTITAALHLLDDFSIVPIDDFLLKLSRWAFMLSFFVYSVSKKSLTTWIFTAMGIGVLIGLDFPVFSQELKFLSTIFLRLIKTVIAPLLFGTLVVGIASHGDLKQVGRIG